MVETLKGAFADIGGGFRLWRVWYELAMEDVVDSYRRTTLGPLWELVNYVVFVGIMVFVIRRAIGIEHFAVYVATGAAIWFFIADTINGGVNAFIRERSFLEGTTLPLSTYVLRQCMDNVIRYFYTLIGTIGVVAFSGVPVTPVWLSTLPALLLIFLTAPAVTIVLGVAGVVFPDMRFFVNTVMRFGIFLTPVFWSHENIGGARAALYYYSPFTHYLEIFRGPIYAGTVFPSSWAVCLAITSGFWVLAILLLGRYRRRLVLMI